MLVGELLENRRVCRWHTLGCLLDDGKAEFIEQHDTQLLCGVDVEVVSRVFTNRDAQRVDTQGETGAELPEEVPVEPDAGVLHLCEDRDQRHFNLIEELESPAGFELFRERHGEPVDRERAPSRCFEIEGRLVERERRLVPRFLITG